MILEKKHSPEVEIKEETGVQIFNPKIEVNNILVWNRLERKEKLEIFRENLKKQYIAIASIITDFENIIENTPDITLKEYLEKLLVPTFLSEDIIKSYILKISWYFTDREKSKNIFEKYKNNSKGLIKLLYNTDQKLTWDINISLHLWCIVILFDNENDYNIVWWQPKNSSWTFQKNKNLISINVNERWFSYDDILIHELQHYKNSFKLNYRSFEYEDNNLRINTKWFMWYKWSQINLIRKNLHNEIRIDNDSTSLKDELISHTHMIYSSRTILRQLISSNSTYVEWYNKKEKNIANIQTINWLAQSTLLENKYRFIYLNLLSILTSKQVDRLININEKTDLIKVLTLIINDVNKKQFINNTLDNIMKYWNPITYLSMIYKKINNLN